MIEEYNYNISNMSRTQINGNQILDGSITSSDLADDVEFSSVFVSGSAVIAGNIEVSGSFLVIGAQSMEVTGSLYVVDGDMVLDGASLLQVTGSVSITSGSLLLGSGSNLPMGTVTLDGSTPSGATVTNSLVSSKTMVFLTKQTANFPLGSVSVSAKSNGSFSIISSANGDSDTVSYLIINPSND